MLLISTIAALFAILATWMLLAAVCLALGSWHLLALRKNSPTLADFFATFWIGLVTLLSLLQFWHFFAPIDLVAHTTLLTLGVFGFLTILPALLRAVGNTPHRPFLYSALAFLILAIWLANRGTGPNADYDAGLYHIAAVKWTRLYAIVPGLANLHLR